MKTSLNADYTNVESFDGERISKSTLVWILIFTLGIVGFIGMMGVVGAVGVYPPLESGMVRYYHFNNDSTFQENDTRIYDYSNRHLNGTVVNASIAQLPQNHTGGFLQDGAYEHSGITGYINASFLNSNSSSAWTVSAWVYKKGNQSIMSYFSKDFGAFTYFGGTNALVIEWYNSSNGFKGTTTGVYTLPYNEWHLITISYLSNSTGLSANIYVDGTLNASRGISAPNEGKFNASSDLRIGYMFSTTDRYWNGSIDDFIVWNRTLSAKEISWIYYQYGTCVNFTLGQTYSYFQRMCNNQSLNSSSGNTALIIGSNDTNIDLNGFTLSGNFSNGADSTTFRPRGIQMNSMSNVTIRNGNIENYYIGIYAITSSNITIKDINTRFIPGLIDFDRVLQADIYNITSVNASIYGSEAGSSSYLHLWNLNCSNDNTPLVNLTSTTKGCASLSNGTNILIENSTFINHGGLFISSQNVMVNNIRFINSKDKFGRHIDIGGINNPVENITVKDSYFINHDGAIYIENTTNALITRNIFYNSTQNTDTYDMAIHVQYKTKNLTITYNNFTNFQTAVLLRETTNSTVSHNLFHNNIDELLSMTFECVNYASCNGEPFTGIFWEESYKGFIPIGWQGGANITGASLHESFDMNAYNNTFIGVPVAMRSQSNEIIKSDFSGWFRSFRIFQWSHREDFWMSNEFNNASTIRNYALTDILYQGIANNAKYVMNYTINRNYLYFKYYNQTPLESYNLNNSILALYNISSNSLIFSSNGSLPCGNSLFTGDCNITLQPNNWTYVYNNYVLTEGRPLTGEPLTVSGSGTTSQYSWAITSSLTSTLSNVPVNLTLPAGLRCQNINDINGGTFVSCDSSTQRLVVTADLSSGLDSISLNTYVVDQNACNSAYSAFQSYPLLIGLIGTIFLIGLAIMFIMGYGVIQSGGEITQEQVIAFFVTLIGMGLLVIIGIIAISSLCSVGVI